MQGIVTDEKGTKVKAAIVVLLKVKEPEDESEAETATYIETDEEGRFMIQDLNPDDKYFIEIHVERSEAGTLDIQTEKKEDLKQEEQELKPEEQELKPEEPEEPDEPDDSEDLEDLEEWEPDDSEDLEDLEEWDPDDEMGDPIEEKNIIDSLMRNHQIDETASRNISINNLYFVTDVEQKDKLYLYRNSFW